jgi:hypothetical protein
VAVIPIDNVSPTTILDNALRLIITEGIVRLNYLSYISRAAHLIQAPQIIL